MDILEKVLHICQRVGVTAEYLQDNFGCKFGVASRSQQFIIKGKLFSLNHFENDSLYISRGF